MTVNNRNNGTDFNAARFASIGFALGLACMVALFIAGAIAGNAGMMVMASSVGAMQGAAGVATSAAIKKKASTL